MVTIQTTAASIKAELGFATIPYRTTLPHTMIRVAAPKICFCPHIFLPFGGLRRISILRCQRYPHRQREQDENLLLSSFVHVGYFLVLAVACRC